VLQRALNKLPITSITPFTFQDYPEHTACILWFSGCNMACSYCHNPELVKGELAKLPSAQVIEFLESRKGLLEGVVLSGGECMMSAQLPEFARHLKSLGYKVKIDTNGTNPEMLEAMLSEGLIDYVALDYKASSDLFQSITGYDGYAQFEQSLKLLCVSGIALEVRTTMHADLMDEDDINSILKHLESLGFNGIYYLQNFHAKKTLGNLGLPFNSFNFSRLRKPSFSLNLRGFEETQTSQ
jgi:pyruvate formate lyase activating enzyme